jgi:hypothetical protein
MVVLIEQLLTRRTNRGELMEAWSSLIGDPPRAMAVVLGSWTSALNWLVCVSVAVFYTAMVFGKPIEEFERAGPVLSKQNARPISAILVVHAAFLAAVICPICWAFHQFSSFDFDRDPIDIQMGTATQKPWTFSLFGILFCLGLILLRKIERRWIFEDSDLEPSKSESDLVENGTTGGQ